MGGGQGGNLGFQLFDLLLRRAGIRRKIAAQQRFCRDLRDRIGVDQLDDRLFPVEVPLFIAAVVDDVGNGFRILQNLDQARGILCLVIDRLHRFVDVFETEGDVFINGHIRPERVVLEQEANLALVGRHVDALQAVEHDGVPDRDASFGRRFQTRNHAQRRRFAAPGRAEQRDKRVVFDDQIQMIHRVELVITLGDVFQYNFRHD